MAEAASRQDFDQFYSSSAARLIRHGYALTGDLAEAQDIAQEAFARAWQRWSVVRDCDSPEAWVRRVATNLAASRWRRIRWRVPPLAIRPSRMLPRSARTRSRS